MRPCSDIIIRLLLALSLVILPWQGGMAMPVDPAISPEDHVMHMSQDADATEHGDDAHQADADQSACPDPSHSCDETACAGCTAHCATALPVPSAIPVARVNGPRIAAPLILLVSSPPLPEHRPPKSPLL